MYLSVHWELRVKAVCLWWEVSLCIYMKLRLYIWAPGSIMSLILCSPNNYFIGRYVGWGEYLSPVKCLITKLWADVCKILNIKDKYKWGEGRGWIPSFFFTQKAGFGCAVSEQDTLLDVASRGNKNQHKVMHSNKEGFSSDLATDQLWGEHEH